ncbi:MAG: extracellular solute-binding protein [Rhizobiaceae bacterium]|nr:extracellular solute-binding protein [Rhizobiaceae bacterium]MCV0405051.1 extracellular solute-binding protein [Rhizobiaceae bacterium]
MRSGFTRRSVLGGLASTAALPLLARRGFADVEPDTPRHGLSAFGELKYGPDFTHFDYANVDAPKGGAFNFSPPNWAFNQNVATFNTLNSFVTNGDAPPRMGLCFDALMTRAIDEPDALYGLLAETVSMSADRNAFTFLLRPEARWHDGSPLTADDVVFSYQTFKEKGHPSLLMPLREMVSAEAVDERTARLTFSGDQSARTVQTVATYPIISSAWYAERPFDASSMEPPLGSGPYKVGRVSAGLTIEYERVPDYWGRDLPVNRGFYNFDRIRIDFFRERQAGFEAFKKGDVTYRQEFTSQTWATGYDFPALQQGKVVKREFPSEKSPIMQAWALNQRRSQFKDPRVRQAIGLCFDFEWTNRNLFYGAYERSRSCFERSEFVAEGEPSAEELALLEPFRGRIPDEAFGEAVVPPVSDGSGRDRRLLREAVRLFGEAGWTRQNGVLTNKAGQKLVLEILVRDEVFVRVDSPFVDNLRAVGVNASIRMVDAAQYQARQAEFDFDMLSMALSIGATPTVDTLENMFHSRAAEQHGSRNLSGIADPAVDELVAAAGWAESREELTTALRALDRVLRARHDWIPNWHAANHRAAFWDMFGFVEPKPDYGFPVETMWWFDEDKARAIGKA